MDAATAWACATALVALLGAIAGAAWAGWRARGPTVDALRERVAEQGAELERVEALLRDAVARARQAVADAQAGADAARARAEVVAGPPAGPDDVAARVDRLLSAAAAREGSGGGPAPGSGPAG